MSSNPFGLPPFVPPERHQITDPMEQIPFGGMTADQVARRMRGQETERLPIHRVYLRGRGAPLIVEGAERWHRSDGWLVFKRGDEAVAYFDANDVVAIYPPEPLKDRKA